MGREDDERLEEKLETALAERDAGFARMEVLLETLPSGFAFIDRDLRYERVNEALARLGGLDIDEALGRRVDELHSDLADQFVPLLRQVLDTGEPVRGAEIVGRVPGEAGTRHFLVDYFPVYIDDEVEGVSALVRDITDRVHAEASRRELEAEVSNLQRLETVGQLAGGVAHDFNNLLAVIQLRTELLRRTHPELAEGRDLELIEEAVRQGRDLAQRLLRFSRREQMPRVPVDVDDTVRGMEALLQSSVGDRIVVCTDLGDAGFVLLDTGALEQVLLNLVVNARDAIADDGVITVTTRRTRSDDAGVVRLEVCDDGSGMDAETAGRVFEPFFTTKPTGVGVGLGLSTVYGIVTGADGSVQILSALGAGTTISVELPGCEPPVAEEPAQRAPAGESRRVLLVEDEERVAIALRDAMAEIGFEVIAASSGDEALAVAREAGTVDVLVSDVSMPGMSGPELAEAIQQHQDGIPVILMSGYPARELAGRPDRDTVDILQKPFSLNQLVDRIESLLTSD
jgi:two-component system, cell cycle sensor histidine kinase and response regulator CckA